MGCEKIYYSTPFSQPLKHPTCFLSSFISSSPFSVVSFKQLPKSRLDIGPVFSTSLKKLNNRIPNRERRTTETEASVIYIPMRKVPQASLSKEQIEELYSAIEDTGRPFVWSLNEGQQSFSPYEKLDTNQVIIFLFPCSIHTMLIPLPLSCLFSWVHSSSSTRGMLDLQS
jgi:hypothetical protein